MNAQPAASDDDLRHMRRALELAGRGEGYVEPNPMVGCVLVRDGQVVGEGWHQNFGGPHAEVEALTAAGPAARGATAYVTLEPCSHTGKTPPCTQALIRAGVERVVIGARDPNPHVSGNGLAELKAAGIECDFGVMADEAADLIAPFTKLMTGEPWVIAKWAMTLDGKLAAHTGNSRWISCEQSRAKVHQLRGRVDAIVVGAGTAAQDDPLLTARPPGPRTAARIVLASGSNIPAMDNLLRTAHEAPVIVSVAGEAPVDVLKQLADGGVEVWRPRVSERSQQWVELLEELACRQMTNVLVEGGARVLGTLFDADAIDELHVFIAPKLIGGAGPSPLGGEGIALMNAATRLKSCTIEQLGEDAYIHGRLDAGERELAEQA